VISDVRDYSRKEMSGLAEVLAAVPQGLTIATLYYPAPRVFHYTDQPMLYVSQYYLLARGGYAAGNMAIRRGLPFRDEMYGRVPAVSNAWDFVWAAHGAQFDGFVVRPKENRPDSPFDVAGKESVRLIKQAGNWRYYARVGGRALPTPPRPTPPRPTPPKPTPPKPTPPKR
jgi:hypothetical protein